MRGGSSINNMMNGDAAKSLLTLAEPYAGYSLADDHRLVFWDRRGSGLSRRHKKESLTLHVKPL